MTDLLVIRRSFSVPSLHEFEASSPVVRDDDVGRTPPKAELKRKENRPSDSRTMKAVLSCSPGNPRDQWKMKIRALRRRTKVLDALAGEEILASKCSSKSGWPVGKQAAGDMVSVSPRLSPRVRLSKRWNKRKNFHGGSNVQETEKAYGEEYSTSVGDKSGKQANGATVAASPRMSPGDKSQSTGIDDDRENKTDNWLDVNLVMDQSSPPGKLLEETGVWTGEKRAKLISSPPTSVVAHYKQVDDPRDNESFWDVYDDPMQLDEVQERLALYRIKAHKLFWEGKELSIAQLKEEYSSDTLRDEDYFKQYELNCEWYFNPEYCERSAFDDYQRLVLHKDFTYIAWESYHTTCTTLKCDQEFLQFYDELSNKLKSVKDDDVEPDKEHLDAQCKRYETKAHIEAPKIAARFSSIYPDLVHMGITDCTWSAMFDITYHKDLDHVLFEIWKRVAKDKVSFTDALLELYNLDLYPLQHRFIKAEFEERPLRSIKMKEGYYSHVAHIDEKIPEDEVIVLIKEAVNKILPKPLIYVDYIRKKLEVAKEIGVIP